MIKLTDQINGIYSVVTIEWVPQTHVTGPLMIFTQSNSPASEKSEIKAS